MKQLTKEQAIKIFNSEIWKDMSDKEIINLQLYQYKLCVPFDVFKDALGRILGRGVYTHEFAGRQGHQNLIDEYLGEKEPPTFKDVIDMIPGVKTIILT